MTSRLGFSLLASFVSALFVIACGGGGGSSERDGCNPIASAAGTACLSPFPSSVYMVDDPSTRTGVRVDFPEGSLPKNSSGVVVDGSYYAKYDGFSPDSPFVVAFPGGVAPGGIVGFKDMDKSVTTASTTVILDMETGELHPHFAELDAYAPDVSDQSLIIRPGKRLKPKHRYAIAVTKGLKSAAGGELPIAPGFQALVDGKSYDHPLFARISGRYPEIFAKLEAAGFPKANLAVAWDVVTASDEFLIEDLKTMRDKGLADMGDGSTLTYTVQEDASKEGQYVLRYLHGKFDAPNFLTDGEHDNSLAVRGEDGLPKLSGRARFSYAAVLPKCLESNPRPVPLLVFGHGLFGSAEGYLDGGLLQQVADDDCVVIVAADWIGLSSKNVSSVVVAIGDINKGRNTTEKLMQSVVNFMALVRLTKSQLLNDPMFKVNDTVVIDPTKVYYYGASLGGIMGGTFMSYEPDIARGVLGVPGCNWSICFQRSFAWSPLQAAMTANYAGGTQDMELIALMAMAFDRVDASTTSGTLTTAPITGVPPKQIFMYATLGDSLVPNLSSDIMTRTMGLKILGPSVHTPFGIEVTSTPQTSGMVWFDEHPSPLPADTNTAAAEDNGTHAGVHDRPAVQAMVERFLFQGMVENVCSKDNAPAPCDCATGACESVFKQ